MRGDSRRDRACSKGRYLFRRLESDHCKVIHLRGEDRCENGEERLDDLEEDFLGGVLAQSGEVHGEAQAVVEAKGVLACGVEGVDRLDEFAFGPAVDDNSHHAGKHPELSTLLQSNL